MNERVKFIARYLQKDEPFSALCERAGVSRKTGYKWVARYDAGGVAALIDRSRAPQSHPHAVASEVVERILAVRRRHPRWGPRKLLVVLTRQQPARAWPVASTVGAILRAHGLVRRRGRRRCGAPYGERLADYAAPNAIWCADFKGHFPVGDARCHPLTIMDGFSRYLLRCHALPRPLSTPAQAVFESAFREFGLPHTIRTDNGAPFSTLAPGGLSRLAVWGIRLGIRPERIVPGRPDQNGRHERMHRTWKAEIRRAPHARACARNSAASITIGRMRPWRMRRQPHAIRRRRACLHADCRSRSIPRTFSRACLSQWRDLVSRHPVVVDLRSGRCCGPRASRDDRATWAHRAWRAPVHEEGQSRR